MKVASTYYMNDLKMDDSSRLMGLAVLYYITKVVTPWPCGRARIPSRPTYYIVVITIDEIYFHLCNGDLAEKRSCPIGQLLKHLWLSRA